MAKGRIYAPPFWSCPTRSCYLWMPWHDLPTTVKLSLLNSTFLKYEHAALGTVLTTLNVGSIVLIFFQRFSNSKFKCQAQNKLPVPSLALCIINWFIDCKIMHLTCRMSLSLGNLLVIAERKDIPPIV